MGPENYKTLLSLWSHKIIYSAFLSKTQKSFESAESSSPSTSRRELPRPFLRRLPSISNTTGGRIPQKHSLLHVSQVGGESPRMKETVRKVAVSDTKDRLK